MDNNPYSPPRSATRSTKSADESRLGPGFLASFILAFLLALFLPVFPMTLVIAIIGSLWAVGGIALSFTTVRGYGWFGVILLGAFYVFLAYNAWSMLSIKQQRPVRRLQIPTAQSSADSNSRMSGHPFGQVHVDINPN